jgi:hypothetical protein
MKNLLKGERSRESLKADAWPDGKVGEVRNALSCIKIQSPNAELNILE